VSPCLSALVAEYQRIKENHQLATRRTAARVVLGPSVIRVFKAGTTKDLVPVLVAMFGLTIIGAICSNECLNVSG